jgi:hypothetical protein
MKNLKEKANAQRHASKQDQRAVKLEQERDWFRSECLALHKLCKQQKQTIADLKQQKQGILQEKCAAHAELISLKKTA